MLPVILLPFFIALMLVLQLTFQNDLCQWFFYRFPKVKFIMRNHWCVHLLLTANESSLSSEGRTWLHSFMCVSGNTRLSQEQVGHKSLKDLLYITAWFAVHSLPQTPSKSLNSCKIQMQQQQWNVKNELIFLIRCSKQDLDDSGPLCPQLYVLFHTKQHSTLTIKQIPVSRKKNTTFKTCVSFWFTLNIISSLANIKMKKGVSESWKVETLQSVS